MDSLMGWKVNELRSLEGEFRDIEMEDLTGVKREETDEGILLWKKEDLGLEEMEEVRVAVAMAAIL